MPRPQRTSILGGLLQGLYGYQQARLARKAEEEERRWREQQREMMRDRLALEREKALYDQEERGRERDFKARSQLADILSRGASLSAQPGPLLGLSARVQQGLSGLGDRDQPAFAGLPDTRPELAQSLRSGQIRPGGVTLPPTPEMFSAGAVEQLFGRSKVAEELAARQELEEQRARNRMALQQHGDQTKLLLKQAVDPNARARVLNDAVRFGLENGLSEAESLARARRLEMEVYGDQTRPAQADVGSPSAMALPKVQADIGQTLARTETIKSQGAQADARARYLETLTAQLPERLKLDARRVGAIEKNAQTSRMNADSLRALRESMQRLNAHLIETRDWQGLLELARTQEYIMGGLARRSSESPQMSLLLSQAKSLSHGVTRLRQAGEHEDAAAMQADLDRLTQYLQTLPGWRPAEPARVAPGTAPIPTIPPAGGKRRGTSGLPFGAREEIYAWEAGLRKKGATQAEINRERRVRYGR